MFYLMILIAENILMPQDFHYILQHYFEDVISLYRDIDINIFLCYFDSVLFIITYI